MILKNEDIKVNEEEKKIILKCKGGGSLIDKPPIFTPNGLSIIVPWRNLLRSFSVVSGERITDYEGSDDYIVNAHISPNNSKLLIGCNVKGEILCWKWKTEILISKTQLKADIDEVIDFYMLPANEKLDKDAFEILVTWIRNDEHHIGVFKSTGKKLFTPKYLKDFSRKTKISIGGTKEKNFLAMAQNNKLFCLDLSNNQFQRWKIHKKSEITCLAIPKDQHCIATGDSSGRILLWYNIFTDKPAQSTYHWHTLPVRCLCFSETGTEMYSGADEKVLVKWHVDNPSKKLFMPRLPGGIVNVSCGPENLTIAVCTEDNGIRLVDAQLHLKSVLQQLVKMSTCQAGLRAVPSGTITSSSGALIMNGRPGHLQFYSAKNQTLLYNLDIIAQNQITPERNLKIPNTEITQVDLCPNGNWLATFECLKSSENNNNGITYSELRLKFWQFDEKQRTFILNTSIELPHEEFAVVGMNFQPLMLKDKESQNDSCCVTIGEDKRFRIWNAVDTSTIYKKSIGWRCTHLSQYRSLPCHASHFTSDGSLLGVTFGPSLTLWKPDNCEMAASLTKPLADPNRDALKLVQFGSGDHCHLVVVASENEIYVWSLLTLGMVWRVPVKLRLLCGDPRSEFMAAVTVSDTLFIFRPGSSNLVYSHKNICGDIASVKTLGMTFVPRATATESQNVLNWQKHSQLYLLNSKQELFSLELEDESSEEQMKLEYTTSKPLSAFAATLPGISVNQTSKQGSSDSYKFGIAANSLSFNQLLIPPNHTTAPMRTLCASVLRSVILTSAQSQSTNDKKQEDESDDEELMEVDKSEMSGDDSNDLPKKRRQRPQPEQIDENDDATSNIDLGNVMAESTNWTSILV